MKACRRAGRWLAHSSWPSPRAPPHTHPHTHTLCAQADTSCSLVWEGIRRQQDMRGQLAWITKVCMGAHIWAAWCCMGCAWGRPPQDMQGGHMAYLIIQAWLHVGAWGSHGDTYGRMVVPNGLSCLHPFSLPPRS